MRVNVGRRILREQQPHALGVPKRARIHERRVALFVAQIQARSKRQEAPKRVQRSIALAVRLHTRHECGRARVAIRLKVDADTCRLLEQRLDLIDIVLPHGCEKRRALLGRNASCSHARSAAVGLIMTSRMS